MPVISTFYGIIVRMFYFDTARHKHPHIHVQCGSQNAVIQIPGGELLGGQLKPAKLKLVRAWVEIHRDELITAWKLAADGQKVFKIKPLR